MTIDILAPFELSVVYLTTDAMPSNCNEPRSRPPMIAVRYSYALTQASAPMAK